MLAEVQSGGDEISRMLRDLAALPVAPSSANATGAAGTTSGSSAAALQVRNNSETCSPALSFVNLSLAKGEDLAEIKRILDAAMAVPDVSADEAVTEGGQAAGKMGDALKVRHSPATPLHYQQPTPSGCA